MLANSMGSPCSAALMRSSAAVRTTGERRSAAGDCLHQVRNGLAQGRQPDATRQDDRLGKAAIPGHDATPERNRDSSACSRVIPTDM